VISYRAPFDFGAHVLIRPLDNMRGRVVTQSYDEGGWTIEVRYVSGGEAKTMRCFLDEVALEDQTAEEERRRRYEEARQEQPSAGVWPP
jgi:hypothetical protein